MLSAVYDWFVPIPAPLVEPLHATYKRASSVWGLRVMRFAIEATTYDLPDPEEG
jgi:hypothetical protein